MIKHEVKMTTGASDAGKLPGLPFHIGDTVVRIGNPDETAEVTYVSAAYDYAEMRYPSAERATCFRTRKSEWRQINDAGNATLLVLFAVLAVPFVWFAALLAGTVASVTS